jgi:hypothetical protein
MNWPFSRRSKSAIFGYYFINNVKNLSDVKIIFQIFNCKSIYIYMIILTTIVIESFIFTAYHPCSKKVATQKWRREKG